MIKMIAAIDSLRGIANEKGIPWDLPSDSAYYKKKVAKGKILMGHGTYLNHESTLHGRTEYVATTHLEPLRDGFEPILDVDSFLNQSGLIWVLGGSQLFEYCLPYADELYITQVNGVFDCTKFFPSFEKDFVLVGKSSIKKENGTEFQYQIWRSRRLLASLQNTADI